MAQRAMVLGELLVADTRGRKYVHQVVTVLETVMNWTLLFFLEDHGAVRGCSLVSEVIALP